MFLRPYEVERRVAGRGHGVDVAVAGSDVPVRLVRTEAMVQDLQGLEAGIPSQVFRDTEHCGYLKRAGDCLRASNNLRVELALVEKILQDKICDLELVEVAWEGDLSAFGRGLDGHVAANANGVASL